MDKKESFLEKIRKMRRDQWIVLLAGILILVVSLPPAQGQTGASESGLAGGGQSSAAGGLAGTSSGGAQQPGDMTVSGLEERLEEILSAMEGAGDVRVMITVKDGGEKIVEKDAPSSSRTAQEEQNGAISGTTEEERQETTVFEKNGSGYETPYVTQELAPRVEGVLVLAEGADNAVVKKDITDAVMALFDLDAHKIKVMKMYERRG